MKRSQSFLPGLFVLVLVISACAPTHQVVQIKGNRGSDGSVVSAFGVTYNNILIPEYTESPAGSYAPTYDEAWGRFDKRVDDLDSWLGDKYKLPNSSWYQLSSLMSKMGLLAMSPFVLPVEWVGERVAPDPALGISRSFREIAADFFAPSYDPPTLRVQKPKPNVYHHPGY